MSHPPPGALAGYSSLGDKHLAGYFGNSKMKKHLKKSGLVSRDGTIVEDNTYRLKMAKKEHRKHVRDMLATAIVHKALDMERMHQYEMKKKLEELYKVELVQRIRAERSRKGEEEALNLLPNRLPRESSNVRGSKQRSARSPNSLPDIHYDKSQKRLHYQEKPGRRDGAETSKSREHPLQKAYVQPHPPAKHRKKKSKTHRGLLLARTDSAVAHRIQLQSLAEVTVKYLGSNLNLSSDAAFKNHLEEVTVYQQHCGGSTLCVFKELLSPGTQFSFISRRHRGSPFGLTFYINGLQDCRLSSCCEYKHRPGHRIGGKHGRFSIVDITGAAPCYKCQVSLAMAESRKKKKDEKQNSEESSSESDEEGPQVSYDIIVSTLKKEDNEKEKEKDEKVKDDGKEKEEDSVTKESPEEKERDHIEEENSPGSSKEQEQNEYEEEGFEDDKDEEKDKESYHSEADSVVSSLSSSDSSSSSSDEESEDEHKSDAEDKEESGSEKDDEERERKNSDEESEPKSEKESEEKEDNKTAKETGEAENDIVEALEEEQVNIKGDLSGDDKDNAHVEELSSISEKDKNDDEGSVPNSDSADNKIADTDDEGIQEDPIEEEPPIEEKGDLVPSSDLVESNDSIGENEIPEQLSEEDRQTHQQDEVHNTKVLGDHEPEKSEDEKLSDDKEQSNEALEKEQDESESVVEEASENIEDVHDQRMTSDNEDSKEDGNVKEENVEDDKLVQETIGLESNDKENSDDNEKTFEEKVDDNDKEDTQEKKREDDSDSSSSSSSSSDEEDAKKEDKVQSKVEGSSSDSDSRALDRGNDPDAVALEERPAIKPPSVEPAEKCEGSILPLLNSSTEVELSNIALNKDQVLEIANLLQANDATDSLSLRNAQLDNEAVTVLLDSVKAASNLKMLNLNLNDLGPDGARQIVQSLEDNKELSILMLHSNPLGDEGVEIITSFLKTSKTISSLDLGGCHFGEKGLESVAALLEETPSLTDLNLTGNQVPHEGWKAFSKSLSSNETLKALSLDYNQLGDVGTEILADPGLMYNRSLRSIDLEGNGITNSGAEVLLRVLEKNESIVDITLTPMNTISSDLLDKIKSILAERVD